MNLVRAIAGYFARRKAAKVRAIQAELMLQAKERYQARHPGRTSRWDDDDELYDDAPSYLRRHSSAEILAERFLSRRAP